MRTLNRAASEVLVAHGVAAATDVTGFGLLGHGLEMAAGVRRAVRLRCRAPCRRSPARSTSPRPASRPAARRTTGGSSRPALTVGDGVSPELVALAHDPQTSGGLLAAIDPGRVDAVEADLDGRGVHALARRPGRGRRAGGGPRVGGRMTAPPPSISPGISAVVPVYRSAAILPELYRRLTDALARSRSARDHPGRGFRRR